jgi:hypothetical protein
MFVYLAVEEYRTKEFFMKKNRQNHFGIIVLVSIIGLFFVGCGETANSSPSSIEIDGHKFVIGENKYKVDLEYIVYEMGLSADKVKEPNNGIVNSIYGARQNELIAMQYLDNFRIRVIELHYSYHAQKGDYVLWAIKMFEFDNDATQQQGVADRALPTGEKFSVPILIAKNDRKQTRFKSYVETQKIKRGKITCEYIWTSDLEGISYLIIYEAND